MPQFTIETNEGIDDFLQKFITEVKDNGRRFKTCHFEEAGKDDLTTLLDYNFSPSHKDLPSLTSTDSFKVTFKDDAYPLPNNVVLPSLETGDWLLGYSGLQGGTFGTYLMAIQHYFVDSSFTDYTSLVLPNKSRIPLFNSILDINLLTRNFPTFNSLINTYIELNTPVIMQIGDTLEFLYKAPNAILTGSHQYVIHGDGVDIPNMVFFGMFTSGSLGTDNNVTTLEIDGISKVNGDAYPIDGKIHHVKMTAIAPCNTQYVGCRYQATGSFYSGNVYDLFFTLAAGNQSWSLDSDLSSDIEFSKETTFGSELINSSLVLTNDLSISYDNNKMWSFDYSGGFSALWGVANFFPTDGAYILDVIKNTERGSLSGVLVGNGNNVLIPEGVSSQAVNPADGSDNRLQFGASDFKGTLTISVRKIQGNFATYYNFAESPVYELTDDGWLGSAIEDALTFRIYGTLTNTSFTYVENILTINSLTSNVSYIGASIGNLDSSSTYAVEVIASQAAVDESYLLGNDSPRLLTLGLNEEIMLGDDIYITDRSGHDAGTSFMFDIQSVKHLIEVA